MLFLDEKNPTLRRLKLEEERQNRQEAWDFALNSGTLENISMGLGVLDLAKKHINLEITHGEFIKQALEKIVDGD